jgi:hypothetical protein
MTAAAVSSHRIAAILILRRLTRRRSGNGPVRRAVPFQTSVAYSNSAR